MIGSQTMYRARSLEEEQSGELSLSEDRRLCYASPVFGDWCVDSSRIKLVGELTTPEGPGVDDWFIVLVISADQAYMASMFAIGHEQILRVLGVQFNSDLHGGLAASTDWASRAIWPPELAGKKLFIAECLRNGVVQRLMRHQVRELFTSEVVDYLEEQRVPLAE